MNRMFVPTKQHRIVNASSPSQRCNGRRDTPQWPRRLVGTPHMVDYPPR